MHIIGHGSAGEILFGNAFLNNDTITNYQSTLASIGQSLTTSGDILFYGCNVASTDQGEILIKKISEITKADIASSDDITGKGGDWELEKKIGIVETKNVQVFEYNNSLGTADAYGIASYNSDVVEKHSATNFKASYSGNGSNDGGQSDHPNDRFMITQEQQHKTSGTFSFTNTGGESQRHNYAATSVTASSTNPINIYLVYLNNNIDRLSYSSNWGEITFEHEIIGIYNRNRDTIAWSGVSKDGATYPTSSAQKFNRRGFEDFTTNGGNDDWVVSNGNKTLTLKSDNGEKGDFIRVFTYASLPVANNDTGYINEGETLSVSNSAPAVSGTTSGSHSGDVESNDTDSGGHTLTITSVRKGSSEGSGSSGSVGSALSGDYGQLTLNPNGSYSYVANNDISGLESGSTVTDSFNYTISDGLTSDIATITITIIGQSTNDAPAADNETNSVLENNTVTVTDGASDVLDGDTDADDDPLTVTQIAVTGSGDNAVTASSTYNSGSPATVTGTYGTLTIGADGTYTYVADQSAADDLDAGDIVTDSFTYTVSDGTATDTATLIITVTGINDAPVAVDDTDSVNQNTTGTRSSGSKLLMADDSDVDDHDSFTVTQIGLTGQSSSGVNAGSSYNSNGTSITGTYGTLTVGADGTYTYVAGSSNGSDSFTYTISDGTATDTATLIITVAPNFSPTVVNDTDSVTEGGTVIETTNGQGTVLSDDSDDDGDNLTVSGTVSQTSATANGGSSITISSPNSASVGSAVTGYYGQLTLDSDGTYSYVANQSTANALDDSESGTDVFTFTVSDGTTTTSSTITITVNGQNDAPTVVNDTDSVTEGGTVIETTNSQGTVLSDDSDDDGDNLTVSGTVSQTSATANGGSSITISSPNSASVGSAVTGYYGQLTLDSDGTYSYVANQSTADALDGGESGTDVFTFTVSDGTTTTSSTITITVNGIFQASSTVEEDGSVSVADGGSALSPSAVSLAATTTSFSGSYYIRFLNFNDDGTKLIGLNIVNDSLYQYYLDTPYDFSSYSSVESQSIEDFNSSPYGLAFSRDGSKVYTAITTSTEDTLVQTSLSTAWDTETVSTSADNTINLRTLFGISSSEHLRGISTSEDGTEFYIITSGDKIHQITLGTAWDISSYLTPDVEYDFSSTGPSDNLGMHFSPNGKKLFIWGYDEKMYEYTLETEWHLSSGVTYEGNLSLSEINSTNYGSFTFSKDGSRLLVLDVKNGYPSHHYIKEYTLPTPFSLISVDQTISAENITTVSSIRTGQSGGSGTTGSINTALTGTYGQLTIQSTGSYSYVANQDAADALDPGDIVYDYFTINGNTELTITVVGINDTPSADNETNSVDVSSTLTVSDDDTTRILYGDTDDDTDASLTVSAIRTGSSEGAGTAGTIGSALTGSYGALTMAADGTYTYVAGSSAGTDSFNYTVTDEFGATDIATLTITVNSSNAAPTASNSTVYINENNQVSSAGDRTPSNITKVFAASDFNFSDTDGGSLSKVKITTLESAGALEYNNGSSWVDVTEDQEITASDISNNKLRFTPAANSESNPTFGFKVHDGTDYSSSAYTMTISVNAAPDVTNATVGSTVSAGGTSSGDVHDGVADSDDDDSVLVVTGVASGNESSNNTIITNNTGVGSAVSGTYGSLNIAANGTYTYTASATNNIAFGANATDIFTFTTRDDESNSGSFAYDVGSITFTVASSISLTDDTDSVNEDATVTKTGSQDDVLNDDAADTNGLVVTHIKKDGGSNSTVAGSSTYTSNGTSVTGTYGTLVIGADGSYTYTADQDAADALDLNDQVTDVFVYTADGATATLTITVTGINDDPTAVNDTGYIKEGGTLTVANSAAASSGTSTGNHTGDMTDNDTDDDASSTATITSITATTAEGNAQTTFSSNSETVTGAYGTLTINSNGSYSYVANSNISGLDAGDANITDVFTYIVSDGTATSTATLTINVIASQDLTARNDTGTVNEDATLEVDDGDNANSVTAISSVRTTSISSQETYPRDVTFNNDGTKMFVIGATDDAIDYYTLSTAYDTSTATHQADYLRGTYTTAWSLSFNNDGTKLFIVDGDSTDAIYEYSLSTPYDLSNLTLESSRTGLTTYPTGHFFNSDGTKLFLSFNDRTIKEYSLSVGFDLSSTFTLVDTLDISSDLTGGTRGVKFNDDGTKMFVSTEADQKIFQYDLPTGFDLTNAALKGNVSHGLSYMTGFTFKPDGSQLFLARSGFGKIVTYDTASPFELTDVNGEYSGDVINTSSTANYDTDPDDDTLTITSITATTAGGSAQTTFSSNTEAVTGSYGILTINSNGSYQYAATLDATRCT